MGRNSTVLPKKVVEASVILKVSSALIFYSDWKIFD